MGFWPTRSKDKLYKQWSEYSGLPYEAIPKKEVAPKKEAAPRKEVAREAPVREGGGGQRLYILYALLGVAILMLCAGIIILLMQSS